MSLISSADPPPAASSGAPIPANRDRIALLLVLVIAAIVRCWGLFAQSFTKDEITELAIGRSALSTIAGYVDGFPPLSQFVLHAMLAVLPGDNGARWLAVLYGLIAVAVMWRLAVDLFDQRTGLIAAAMLALSPVHIFYSQEGRAYALTFLFALVSLWRLFRALDTNRGRDWMWYAAATLAGLYTHYFFSILVVTEAALVLLERPSSPVMRSALLTAAASAIALIPWVFLLQHDLSAQVGSQLYAPFNIPALAYAYFTFIVGYGVGPSTSELHTLSAARAAAEALPWAVLGGGGVILLGWQGVRAIGNGRLLRRLILLAVLPVLVCGLIGSFSGVGFRVRYVIWATVPILLLLAAGFRPPVRWPAWLGAASLFVTSLVSVANRRYDARYENEDLRALATYLRQHASPTVPIYVLSGYMTSPIRYYLGSSWAVYPVQDATVTPPAPPDSGVALVRRTSQSGERIRFVYTRAFHGDPHGTYRAAIADIAPMTKRAEFPGIELFDGTRR